MLQPDGLVDKALQAAGLGSLVHLWLADVRLVFYTMFVVITWKYVGFSVILFLAGLQGIPAELHEAAAIDGAGELRTIRHVTIPLLGPTLRIWAFLTIIGSLQLFDLVWIMTLGGPANASNTMATYMIDRGFVRYQLGYGSAVAVILFSISLVFAILYQRYVLLGGFRTTGQIAAKPVDLPHPWVTGNYTEILHSGSFWREVTNSTIIAVVTTVVVVGAGALAAFPLSRYLFRGREGLYTLFTLGLLFPISVAVLPLYILLRPFMRAVPAELEDAAIIDGCSRFGFFWRVLLPLSRPALMTVSILAFVKSWNNFLLPLLVLTDEHGWTLPLGVANYSTQYSQDTARVLAFTALSMLPALCFFVLAERRIVGGLSGAVKG